MNKIVLGLVAVLAIGIGLAVASFASVGDAPQASSLAVAQVDGNVQEVYIRALDTGLYDKQEVVVKKGVQVRLHFSADVNSGCGKQFFVPDFGVRLLSVRGEEKTAVFTPARAGVFAYRCGMNMFRGKMVVE